MSEQLTVPIALGAIIALLVITLVIVLLKRRKPTSAIDDAVLEAVYVMAKAPLELREGLDQAAAEKMTSRLLKLLKSVAVGITDGEGTLLAWDGEANDHYVDLVDTIGTCIRKHRREVVSHDKMPCNHRGTCKMRTAVLVPLIVEGETDAVLIVVGKTKGKRIVQMADAVARFVGTQLEAARLEDTKHQLHQAEIKALRAQISPHFVYNALNTISSLIRTDPEEARELLQDFADFTRYCFRAEGTFTTLSDELRNIDRYLTIESARYGGRLGVRLKIAPEVQSVVVPFLLIQPLVENAVKHGIANKPGGGTVTVTAQDYGTEAEISVEDDGVGMDPKQLDGMRDSRSSAHIGLTGINRRMSQVFGNRYSLIVETAPGAGMKVTMRVPKFVRGVRPDMLTFAAEDTSEDDQAALPAETADGSLAASSAGSGSGSGAGSGAEPAGAVPAAAPAGSPSTGSTAGTAPAGSDGTSGAPTPPPVATPPPAPPQSPVPAPSPSTPPTQRPAPQHGPGQHGPGQPGPGRGGPASGPAGPAPGQPGSAPAQPGSAPGRRGSTHPGMTPAHGASSPGSQQRPSTQQPPAAPPQEDPAPGQGTRQTSSQPSRRPVARQASEAKQAARAAQVAARNGKSADRERRDDEEPDPTSTPRST